MRFKEECTYGPLPMMAVESKLRVVVEGNDLNFENLCFGGVRFCAKRGANRLKSSAYCNV
jgi:hypothetical protein